MAIGNTFYKFVDSTKWDNGDLKLTDITQCTPYYAMNRSRIEETPCVLNGVYIP